MSQQRTIRWGIVGPGVIAKAFAGAAARTDGTELAAIATRHPGREGLAADFPGARILEGYQALLDDPAVDAVYVATPHPGHAEWAIKAAEAGKHVLCEKPIAVSAAEAEAMIHAARKAGTFLGEAFMYRPHPMTARLIDLVRTGMIGDVRMIRSTIGFIARPDPKGRLRANELAGGGIMDVGCYPVSVARLIAGAVAGKPFLDPVKVVGAGHLGATGVDEWAAAVLTFPNDVVAEVAATIAFNPDCLLRIDGTAGSLEVDTFWFASGRQGGRGEIKLHRNKQVETIAVDEPRWLYTFEIDAANTAIRTGRQEFDPPGMTWPTRSAT
jgi:predicted dehydrogenase